MQSTSLLNKSTDLCKGFRNFNLTGKQVKGEAQAASRKRKAKSLVTKENLVQESQETWSIWYILKQLPARVHRDYANAVIRNISFDVFTQSYKISMFSKKCLNLGTRNGTLKEHQNNHVYFVVTSGGIHQRCYCDCTDKTCRTFQSKLVSIDAFLTPLQRCTLFPTPRVSTETFHLKKLSSKTQSNQQMEQLYHMRGMQYHKRSFVPSG